MTNSFWTGGPRAYATGLKREFESRLRQLRERHEKAGDDSKRASIRQEIEAARVEYETKRKQFGRLLF